MSTDLQDDESIQGMSSDYKRQV